GQHLGRRARLGRRGRQVRERDRAAHRVPEGTARDPPDRDAVDADRLVAEHLPQRVLEREAGQPASGLRTGGDERVATDEVTLVEPYAEAEPTLVRRVVRCEVAAPVAVALLGTERVDGAVPAPHQADVLARR